MKAADRGRRRGRSGRYATRKARRAQWELARANLLRFGLVVVGLVGAGLVAGVLIGGWLGGFVAGILVTAGVGMPFVLLPAMTGATPQLMGADAERDTSDLLRRSVRNGAVAFDGISMANWEVDHVVLAQTKALVVETKWRSSPWDVVDDPDGRLAGAVAQVRANARHVRVMLASRDVGLPVPVDPVVVIWGRMIDRERVVFEFDGCPVVHGSALRSWVRVWCDGIDLPDASGFEASAERLAAYLEARDANDAALDEDPWIVRRGVVAPVTTIYQSALAALVSLVLCLSLPRLLGGIWPALGVAVGCGAMGLVLLRKTGHRAPAIAWMASAGVAAALFAVVLLAQAV